MMLVCRIFLNPDSAIILIAQNAGKIGFIGLEKENAMLAPGADTKYILLAALYFINPASS